MTNDPKDRHVLASAVASQSQIIVTDNLRDFGDEALAPLHIKAYSSNAFLTLLFDNDPVTMTQIMMQQANDMRRPPKTYSHVLDSLRTQAPTFVERLISHLPPDAER